MSANALLAATPDATPRPKKKISAAAKTTPTPTPKPADEEASVPPPAAREHAPVATLAPGDLSQFSAQPPRVQQLISAALELTRLNLTYAYGSADPARGGMDCSGTISYLLRAQGWPDVPRDSSGQYEWVRKNREFFAVVSKSAESFEFDDLRPGDLMFWTGTYETGREIPISHVMLYLGTEKKSGGRVMFGASDGRSYAGVQRWGVSVFDFKMPRAETSESTPAKVDFVGYGRIPGLRGAVPLAPAPPREISDAESFQKTPAPASTPKPKSSAPISQTRNAKTTPRRKPEAAD